MEPVSGRTRRRCEQNLMKQWRSWKKANTSSTGHTDQAAVNVSSSPPASLSSSSTRSIASVSTSDTMPVSNAPSLSSPSATPSPVVRNNTELGVRSGCYDAICDSRRQDEEDQDDDDNMIIPDKPVISSSPPVLVISSSSETEDESEVSSSSEDSGSVSSDFVGVEEEGQISSSESTSSQSEDDELVKGKRRVGAREAKLCPASTGSKILKKESRVAKGTRSIERPNVIDDTDNHNLVDGGDHEVVNDGGDDGDVDIVEDDDDNEMEVEESGVGRVVQQIVKEVLQPNKQGKRRPLTADEIHHVLYNSIMEDGNSNELEEPVKLHVTEDEDTSSSDADSAEETDSEKSEQEIDSMYKMLDFCLACGDDNDSADLDDEEQLLGVGKKQEQLCNEGKHYLILDEEIGIICKSCGIVREEIKHITAPFHKNLFGVSERNDYYTYYYHDRDAGGLPHFEDPNCEHQHHQEDANFNPTGTVWEIIPGLRRTLLPHQRDAFEFLWRNIAGGTKLDELKTSSHKSDGGGCLISHAPGTGKTRLSIAFLETYMKFYEKSRPLIIAPASILLTWKKEFKKWKVGIPFLNMNDEDLSVEEIATASSLFKINCGKKLTLMDKRMVKLLFWCKKQSVLAVSYTLFSQLAGGDSVKQRGRVKKNSPSVRSLDQSQMIRKILIELPGLLILDEGHMPRNDRSSMFKVLSDVETKKRFILSGTPFQNNFRELHNILCLVRPEFNKEKNPFTSCVDKADEDKIRELKANMKPFSHCYDGYVVSAMVPGLVDNIIYLEPSEHQSRLLKDMKHKTNHFEVNVDMTLISVHPLLFHCKSTNPNFGQELKSRRWDLADGAKTMFLKRLIELSSALEERVLVFSQYLDPLNFVKAVLESSDFGWIEGREVLLMSGKQDMETRKRSMDFFNKTGSEAKVMLASTKACSEGIELTGASRVVLLDVTWNPAVERQAISRAYRIGQQKVVHVYHLIMTDNDSSRHICQTQKNKFSKYVFSSSNRKHNVPTSAEPDCKDIILERLLEEKVIKDAVQQKKSEAGLGNGI